MASDHERELRQSCLAALEVMNKACESRDGSPVRIATIADVDYRVVFLALLKGAANGDPLAGSEQRGAAANGSTSVYVGESTGCATVTPEQSAPHPQRGAASSTPHPSAAPQVPTAPHGDSGLTGSGPAVAAPSAVEELDRSWLTIRAGQEMRVASHVVALRHARELDELRTENKFLNDENLALEACQQERDELRKRVAEGQREVALRCAEIAWRSTSRVGADEAIRAYAATLPADEDASRLVSISDGSGSTHTRTAAEWLALARTDLQRNRSPADEGSVRVPVEPTEAMYRATDGRSDAYGYNHKTKHACLTYESVQSLWSAMLAAAKGRT